MSVQNVTVHTGINRIKESLLKNQFEERILKALADNPNSFDVFRDLALSAGFKGVNDINFKNAFNNLILSGEIHPDQFDSEKAEGEMNLIELKEHTMQKLLDGKHLPQQYWKQHTCSKCDLGKPEEDGVYCSKFDWKISKKLAETQQLCVF